MITKEQRAAYLKSPYHCPFCDSKNISARDWDAEIASETVLCEDCGKQWWDSYKLTDIEEIE